MTMGFFDKDPNYQKLKKLRESGYDGPVDQNGDEVTSGPAFDILMSLRKKRKS